MGESLFAQDYPEFLHRCLEKDAELASTWLKSLRTKMDSDLLRLYHEVELPVSSVLVHDAPRRDRRGQACLREIPGSGPARA